MSNKVGIVIPTYNEEENLKKILPFIRTTFPPDTSILIMDYGSKDKTLEVSKEYNCITPYVKGKGFGIRLVEGLERLCFENECDYIIQMDGDHNPQIAFDMLNKLKNESIFDFLIGVETGTRSTRTIPSMLNKQLFGKRYSHPTCGFRVWRKRAIDVMSLETPN
jgi:glycosyltransferase involved in cell wall biosynthesis